ncbi:xylitol oxidase [Cryobacterium roopkundense]|uniref:Xylitol oxidase n=1 Tax=Cryobacterium roopkundense TaxID=1001240 RepID=A0A7W8ZYS9_9MICO|nr:xylitol oxidase [Cryobacterium roopkundense]
MTTELNWAGNYRYEAVRLVSPATVPELQEAVAAADRVRALGSRHSFNDSADTPGTLVSLAGIPADLDIDEAALTVTVGGGTRYGVLAEELSRRGFALHNLASLPHISVAGAIATGTHGSGDRNGNLATAVRALELVTGSGELMRVTREVTPDFAGMVVGLGALGIVTRVTLAIEPTFDVRQDVFENLPWSRVLADFDEVTGAAYSVSLFTDWSGDAVEQAWLKSRAPFTGRPEFFGGSPATVPRHPLPGISGSNCTEQLGAWGPWHDRLAHFRLAFTPSNGAELQSEYLVPREHAVVAIEAMRGLSSVITPLLLVSEVRTVAADDLWLSANQGRDGIGLHFTWKPEQAAVEKVLVLIEAALAPFAARPHWGKLFELRAADLAPLYPRFADFRDLAERMDPQHTFRNDFLKRTVFGG